MSAPQDRKDVHLPTDSPDNPTQWDLVWQARNATTRTRLKAVNALCTQYWRPVYNYMRYLSNDPTRAEDLTQGFFERVVLTDWFTKVDQSKGMLRSFLFASCKNFYLNAQTYDHASKRGKRHVHIKLEEAEADYHEMMQVDSTADQIFHRTWAWETVNLALNALRQSIKGKNKALKLRLLDRLNDDEKTTTAEIAAEFGVTDSKVRTALMRLREDLEFYILAETGRSIASKDPADIKAELKILRSKL